MRKELIVLLLFVAFYACEITGSKRSKMHKEDKVVETRTFKTKSGKEFVVSIDYSKGQSLCEVQVENREFEIINSVHEMGIIDPVEKIFLADLDNNGFEELYITTRSTGSGYYSEIYGFASNRDKSISQIYVPDFELEGFMGHNSFTFENGSLVLQYPCIYTEIQMQNRVGVSEKLNLL